MELIRESGKIKLFASFKAFMIVFFVFYSFNTFECTHSRSVLGLINELGSENVSLKVDAHEGLLKIGEPAVSSLVYAIKHKNRRVAHGAESVLFHIGNPAVEPLIKVLNDTDIESRIRVVTLLGKLKTPKAVVPLLNLLNQLEPGVTKSGSHSRINRILTRKVIWALGEIKEIHSVESLISLLRSSRRIFNENDFKTRIAVIQALEKIEDKRRMQPLIDGLKDKNSQMRIESAAILGRIKETRAVQPLIETLKDKNLQMRQRVILALGQLKDERAIEPLINLYYKEKLLIKRQVVYVLGEIGNPKPLGFLTQLINHDDYIITENVFRALAKIGKPAVAILKEALENKNNSNYIHQKAIEALRHINPKNAIGH
ncbi:MAG: HEAT repeat domain-containing protein [bacterium]|nr:HEAT repeat domain-containing protein [bacterium]